MLQVTADGAQFFVESGEGLALERTGHSTKRAAVRTGRRYSRKAGQPTGASADRHAPTFVKAMPPAFRDTFPPRLAKLKLRDLEPKPGPEYTYRDVED